MTHSSADSVEEGQLWPQDTSLDLSSGVPLSAWLMDAWAAAPIFRTLTLPTPKSRYPCLALRCDENRRCSARTFRGTEAFGEASIKPGSHSFVKVPHEAFIRASKMAFAPGKASGHCILADEQPSLFAGEIEIGDDCTLLSWNNMSGTYRFPTMHAGQAALPLDMFWGLVLEGPTPGCKAPNWRSLPDGMWLHKSEEITPPDKLQGSKPVPLGAHPEKDSEYVDEEDCWMVLDSKPVGGQQPAIASPISDRVWASEEIYDQLSSELPTDAACGRMVLGVMKEVVKELKTRDQRVGELEASLAKAGASEAELNAELRIREQQVGELEALVSKVGANEAELNAELTAVRAELLDAERRLEQYIVLQ